MDIDIDIPLPEQIAVEDRDGQDDYGNDETADHEGQAARRAFRGLIRHGAFLAEVATTGLVMKGSRELFPAFGSSLGR
jgi:hypothetical protein